MLFTPQTNAATCGCFLPFRHNFARNATTIPPKSQQEITIESPRRTPPPITQTRCPHSVDRTLGAGLRSVLYIGDSNMQQYYPRIEVAFADHPLNSRGAVFAVRDWCAPVESDIPNSYGATSPELCTRPSKMREGRRSIPS